MKARRICGQPGCPMLALPNESRCVTHQQERDRQSRQLYPTPAEQGYDLAWQKKRAAFLKHYPYCVECGAPATDVDHVIPKRNGGPDDDDNLQPLCHACHSRKTAREVGFGGRVGMAG